MPITVLRITFTTRSVSASNRLYQSRSSTHLTHSYESAQDLPSSVISLPSDYITCAFELQVQRSLYRPIGFGYPKHYLITQPCSPKFNYFFILSDVITTFPFFTDGSGRASYINFEDLATSASRQDGMDGYSADHETLTV
ncbi:hypothetical protein VTO42DRAFT_6117 [Malbranchea cinnamomea]